RIPVREQPQVELSAEHACNRPLLGQPGEGMRNESEDVELHRATRGRLASVRETPRDNDSARGEIDVEDAVLDHGQEETRIELEDVVRRSGRHVAHMPEHAAVLFLDAQADELEDVVLALAGWSEGVPRHLEGSPA